jgi:hypothetical protein
VRFDVVPALSTQAAVLWVVPPCGRVVALKMEAVRASETLLNL